MTRDEDTEKMKMIVADTDAIQFSANKMKGASGIAIATDALRSTAFMSAPPACPRSTLLSRLDTAFEKEFGPLKSQRNTDIRMDGRMRGLNDPLTVAKIDSATEAWAKRRTNHGQIKDYPQSDTDYDEQQIGRLFRERGMVLEKPQGSSLHSALDEMARRGVPEHVKEFVFNQFQSFIIQHDWAKAFDHATDFDSGEVRLPFEMTAFEFRITGQRVIVCLGQMTRDDGEDCGTGGLLFTGVNGRWYMPCTNLAFRDGQLIDCDQADGPLQEYEGGLELLRMLSRQIRAVCIVLEAKVAEAEVVRVSTKMQERRAKEGRLAMKDYHVVNLAHRHRVKPQEDHLPSDRRRPRCHFRRGHWRHFTDHRTWIEWMLVGDPDLGFVEKEYKL